MECTVAGESCVFNDAYMTLRVCVCSRVMCICVCVHRAIRNFHAFTCKFLRSSRHSGVQCFLGACMCVHVCPCVYACTSSHTLNACVYMQVPTCLG